MNELLRVVLEGLTIWFALVVVVVWRDICTAVRSVVRARRRSESDE